MSATKLAIVGVGKIVRDQHLPAIAGNPDFELICTASRHGTVDGVASYGTIETMLEAVEDIEAEMRFYRDVIGFSCKWAVSSAVRIMS